jgi:hypothetical protein
MRRKLPQLTPLQAAVAAEFAQPGFAVTAPQLALRHRVSKTTMRCVLRALQRRGLVKDLGDLPGPGHAFILWGHPATPAMPRQVRVKPDQPLPLLQRALLSRTPLERAWSQLR